jgi:membrane-associated phospholipid phosphatase
MPTNHKPDRLPEIWPRFLKRNRLFLFGLLLFLIIAVIGLIGWEQGTWLWFFNNNRTPVGDAFFRITTKAGEEWAFILTGLLLAFIRFRSALTIPVLAFFVTLVSASTKALFRQPRPLAYFRGLELDDQLNLIEGVRVNASQVSSFPSGHTMAGFALFAFLAFAWPRRGKVAMGFFCLFMAVAVGLSRIYLVQHFLKDVALGAVLGVLVAVVIYYLHFRPGRHNPDSWLDRRWRLSIFRFRKKAG